MSKATSIGIWVITILTALAFAAAGTAKLMGVPQLHASFGIMGLPSWFGYFIGFCELSGAIGLLIRPLSALAASGLVAIMLGAIFFHVHYEVVSHAVPAIVLTVLLAIIIRVRYAQAVWFPVKAAA